MKILGIQNKMGIGDTVIYLPFIRAISIKFNCPVSLLVKENSKAEEFLNQTNYIDQVIYLKKNDKNEGILGSIKLAKELKKYNFEKVFIFVCVRTVQQQAFARCAVHSTAPPLGKQ